MLTIETFLRQHLLF